MDLLAGLRRHVRGIDIAILVGWILILAAARASASLESDPLWEIRAGQEFLDGGPLVHPDTWSWAPVAGDFHPNSPAWNAILALSWRADGFRGLAILTFASVGVLLGLLAYLTRRAGASTLVTAVAVIICALGAYPAISARPSVAAQAVFLLGIAVADRWSGPARSRQWWVTAIVLAGAGFVVSWSGNWLHTSWGLLSAALAVAWVVLWLLAPNLSRRVRATAIVAGTLGLALGTLSGPYGLGIVERSREVSDASLGLIREWIPAIDGRNSGSWLVSALLVMAISLASALHVLRHRREPAREVALQGALVVVALPAAVAGVLVAIRLTAIAWLLVAPAVGVLEMRLATGHVERFLRVILVVGGLVLAPVVLLVSPTGAQPPSTPALSALPQGCRLFATDVDSAAVLLLRPDVRVWFDGRTDYWGRDRVIEATARMRNPLAVEPVPAGATCVLLPVLGPNAESVERVADALDGSPTWRRVAVAADYAVWVGSG